MIVDIIFYVTCILAKCRKGQMHVVGKNRKGNFMLDTTQCPADDFSSFL